MTRRSSPKLLLTRRALRDIQGIYDFSTERWGQETAEKYLDELESGLSRIAERPDLLRAEEDLHASLQFYRVNRHLFVCDRQEKSVVVLTVVHSGMDIPSRLAELQPTLAAEVEILHRKLQGKSSGRKR